jgi:4-aminobutyrate aminotransferase-like enzyme
MPASTLGRRASDFLGKKELDMAPLDYESLSREHVLHAMQREKSVIFERAQGARMWDVDGKMYLDTMSGSAGPAMVGHAHPAVVDAITKQAAKLPTVNLLHDSTTAIEFCARLASIAPRGLSKCFLCPGGGEAVEAAIKFAIHVTGRAEVISLTGGYHGMSLATMSLGGLPLLRSWFPGATRWPTFRQVPSADAYRPPLGEESDLVRAAIRALESSLDAAGFNQPAALLMELVQGPNGHAVFPADYYREVQRVCRHRDILLVVDEIQTGLGRCGSMWACDLYEVRPDILVIGKALGGGMPIGAFITRADLVKPGLESQPWHMLTFMNQPLIAAAGLAVLDIIESEQLVERARTLGEHATTRFREMAERYDVIGDVRGPGLFIGVDFVEDRKTKVPATSACRAAWMFALERGLITQFGGSGGNVYKFKPPVTTPLADFDRMLELSEELVAFIQNAVHGAGAPIEENAKPVIVRR